MASGTITLTRTGTGYLDGRIVWSSTSNGSESNTSTVTASLQIRRNSTTSYTTGTFTGSFTVGGSKASISSYLQLGYDWVTLKTLTVTVSHNDNGAGSCYLHAKINGPSGTTMASTYVEGSSTVSLDTIPRASAIDSAANVTLGNNCIVKWTPKSASFRYKLKFALGSWSDTTGAIHPNKTTAYTYTGYPIPLSVANQIPNARTGTMTVTLYTYSDSGATTQVGSADSETFTITVPDNTDTKPIVSMSLAPVGSLPSAFAGLYIQGMTKVKATISAEGQYGADINTYLMKVDGVYIDADDAFTSGYLLTVGSRTVYGYATDYRGHTGENKQTINVIAYSLPKLDNASAIRCDESGNASESGTYLNITAKRSYSPVISAGVQKNFCKIQYRYSDGLSYTDWVTILDRNATESDEVTTGALLDGGLSAQASYTVQIRAIDDIGRYAETSITIPTDKVYWHRDGARNSLGLGKYNERDNAIDSAWDIYMNSHRITGLPTPTSDADAVPKSYVDPADIRLEKSLGAAGWYKIGTVAGEMCSVVTLTTGGMFVYNQASPSMVDIATQHNQARAFLRLPSLSDNQISKIGVVKESTLVYGVYAYYNSTNENPVNINVHVHMGTFTSVGWVASSVSESDMLAVVTLKE